MFVRMEGFIFTRLFVLADLDPAHAIDKSTAFTSTMTTMSRFRFLVDNRLWDWQPQCHLACLEMFTLDDLPLGVE